MLNDHFYYNTIRNVVSVFGSLFNNISIVRRDSNGNMLNSVKCPLAYGPRQKFLARIEQQADLTDPKIAIKLPRMSFEITSMTYDGSTKLSKNNRERVALNSGVETTLLTPVMYRIGLQLNILAKNQDDALQIIEQILPYFQPDYTVTIKQVDGNFKNDLPFTLNGVSISDDYEGDYLSRRAIIYTLDFETRTKFYSNTSDRGIITRVTTDIRDTDDSTLTARQVVIANPIGDPVDDGDITIVNSFGSVPDELLLTVADGTQFANGDKIYGATSLSNGVVVNIQGNVLRVVRPDNIFTVGEIITIFNNSNSSTLISQEEVYNN